jgi:hypothetical protein
MGSGKWAPRARLTHRELFEDGKFRNVHCRTWNMARKLKITENEKNTL